MQVVGCGYFVDSLPNGYDVMKARIHQSPNSRLDFKRENGRAHRRWANRFGSSIGRALGF